MNIAAARVVGKQQAVLLVELPVVFAPAESEAVARVEYQALLL